MDRGDLVPDEIVLEALSEAVGDLDGQPILLDGFPRTVEQADALVAGLDARGRELTAVILLDVPDEVVVERLAGREQGRADDDPETVRERLRVYHRTTEPLVGYYEQRGLLRRIDGAQGPDAVHDDVRTALDG
jgi:adenylate kinase